MKREPLQPCPECQLGLMHSRRVSYFGVHGGQTVSVPDFPAWVCDVCGRREYDASALAELMAMLQSGSRPRRRIQRPRSGGEAGAPPDRADARRRP
jgi:YgiT-type zinc finger domain-containing protein